MPVVQSPIIALLFNGVRGDKMWLCCVVLVIGAMQAQAAKRQQVLTEAFQEGQSPEVLNQQNDQSQITISGTGTISQNGKTSLNINVEIDGNGGLGNLGQVPPGAKGGRNPGGRFPRPGGRFPKPGGRFPRPGGRFPRPGGHPGRFPGTPAGGVPGGAPPSGAPPGGAPPGGAPPGGAPPGGAPPGGAPPSPPGGPPGEFTTEEEIGLSTHNEFRQIHQVPLMTLDRTMCDEAKAYAEKIAKMGKLEHSSREELKRLGQGENLSYGCSSNAPQTVEEAVTNWYNEVCDPGYDFTSGGFSGGTGHFTQVVWKKSTVLGIGRFEIEEETVAADGTKFKMQCAYIVGRYKPAGNMMGKFQENVPKGDFKPDEYCSSVSSNRRKYFDEKGKAVFISTPFTEVDFPEVTNGASQDAPPPAIELLNSKKKKAFVGSKQH